MSLLLGTEEDLSMFSVDSKPFKVYQAGIWRAILPFGFIKVPGVKDKVSSADSTPTCLGLASTLLTDN